jgi:hypothetical protein
MMASELIASLRRMVEYYGDHKVELGNSTADSVMLYDVPGVIVISTQTFQPR